MKLTTDQWDFLLKDILENNQYNDEETQELWTDIYLRLRAVSYTHLTLPTIYSV